VNLLKKPLSQVHPTTSFEEDIGRLREEIGAAASRVFRELARAVIKLEKYEWDGSLPVKPLGTRDDTFAYEFSPGFACTFRRETELDDENQPALIHLFLERVMRA
jgi:hypothetical protein